jgi:hypothetical protein
VFRLNRSVGRALATAGAVLLWAGALGAQNLPVPPCGGDPNPAYAEADRQPNVAWWTREALRAWAPPACAARSAEERHLVVALAASISHAGTSDELLQRFGAVSNLRGMRYWSVTDREWRVLINDAAAIQGQDPKRRRDDFSARELKSGRDLYFVQADSRSTGEVVYRMRAREARADRVVVEIENVSTVKLFFVPIFKPGELRFVYFLDRRAAGLWGYYVLVFANTPRAEGNEASFINRAAALYRRFTGVPDDAAPPLAP